jgi:hypothetical protein
VLTHLMVLTITIQAPAASIALPTPTGRHNVGMVFASWSDPERRIDTVTRLVGPRQVTVQIWYPGDYGHLMAPLRAFAHARSGSRPTT